MFNSSQRSPSSQEDCHEHRGSEELADRLPPEVLSLIFVLCTQTWCPDEDDFSVQASVPAVCRQWRAVALATTNLWTRIRLSNDASFPRSALFLSRSGSTALLDIEIDVIGQTWTYEEANNPNRTRILPIAIDLFGFIVKHGGDLSRWQRLCVRTDFIRTQGTIMEFLSSHPLPTLRHLELLFSLQAEATRQERAQQVFVTGIEPRLLLHSIPRTLRTAKLLAVSYPRLFGRVPRPQFVGLSRLELSFTLYLPKFAHTHKLLAASSNDLVVLRLDSANQAYLYPTHNPFADSDTPPRITFPKLEALSLSLGTVKWDLGVLQMIDAPNLAVLQIQPVTQSDDGRQDCLQILNLLTYNPDALPSPPFTPYFPSLAHLSYHGPHVNEDLGLFFDVYKPSSLTVPHNLVSEEMYTGLLSCQSITRLRTPWGNVVRVKSTARERHRRGVPLKVIEITDGPVESKTVDELKEWVETVVVHNSRAGWEWDDPMHW